MNKMIQDSQDFFIQMIGILDLVVVKT